MRDAKEGTDARPEGASDSELWRTVPNGGAAALPDQLSAWPRGRLVRLLVDLKRSGPPMHADGGGDGTALIAAFCRLRPPGEDPAARLAAWRDWTGPSTARVVGSEIDHHGMPAVYVVPLMDDGSPALPDDPYRPDGVAAGAVLRLYADEVCPYHPIGAAP